MAMFVHLAPEPKVDLIRRTGIRLVRRRNGVHPDGVFAMPVTRNFYISHQWLRELKRGRNKTIAGVYFRIRDDETVWIGHYAQSHRQMTAAEAVAQFLSAERREGWEVIIPRRIEAKEIHRIRGLPQVLGWRYWPDAHGNKPCPCDHCTRGQVGGQRLRERYRQNQHIIGK